MQCFPMFSTDKTNLEQSKAYLHLHIFEIPRISLNEILSVVQSYNSTTKLRPSTHLNNRIAKLQFVEGCIVEDRISSYDRTTGQLKEVLALRCVSTIMVRMKDSKKRFFDVVSSVTIMKDL